MEASQATKAKLPNRSHIFERISYRFVMVMRESVAKGDRLRYGNGVSLTQLMAQSSGADALAARRGVTQSARLGH